MIYVHLHLTILRTVYTRFGSCGFGEEKFIMYFHYKPMEDNDVPDVSGLYGPRGQLAEFMKRSTIHTCSSGTLWFQSRRSFMFFP